MISRAKVDEDLPRQIADLLIASGYEATSVVSQGWAGIADDVLWSRIQQERRWLVTGDKGFADLRQFPPGSHSGLILLRPRLESRRAYLELARAAIEQNPARRTRRGIGGCDRPRNSRTPRRAVLKSYPVRTAASERAWTW